ncbi:hydantoinase/oxoprolinase family protein [Sphingobium sp.]|jgi:N-methylhydantoinase A|uniref:hydantoinase/oxoprolinase family protein n=1 Tax=Sphingobium sp. TaxID=1912891 RepID=UPI000C3559A4|nr:hydantoinase/oxoprolinase family protein [Sphingobium sp.]MBS88306.1 5-oxoprolinase [Sphingobium sp.]
MRVASDVGGTFTDLVCIEGGTIRTVKADTTPPNFERGVLNAIDKGGLDPKSFTFFAHGTTVVINALLSRKGARAALVTTRGFRDVLEIARANRPDLFNFAFDKPAPFVPRHLRAEITERMDYQGNVLRAPELDELNDIARSFAEAGVEAVAVCLLHAYVNPEHERLVVDHLQALLPQVEIVASHRVCREWREYERTSTTVLSAYISPVAKRYLGKLEQEMAARGLPVRPYIMQSNGGVATVAGAIGNPISMVESGPASGMLGAAELGRMIGEENLIALDIGGTTAKCALVDQGRVRITTEYRIEWDHASPGYPIRTPVVDLVEIGNGGGSIAWIDPGGRLHVGPQSAGAMPGPAAYGRGGTEATTTDANLLLGRINPDLFLGGEHRPDWNAVNTAFQRLADRLGGTVQDVARGVVRIANHNMVNALKLVSLNKGYDPREFTLIAFGGGGAMHAVTLAKELGVKKVLVPVNASVFSAWGMLMSELRRDFIRTSVVGLEAASATEISDTFAEVEREAIEQCVAEGIDRDSLHLERYADLRYFGQEHTIKIAVQSGSIDAAAIEKASADFNAAHKREFTFVLPNAVELVNYHVVALSSIDKQPLARKSATGRTVAEACVGRRTVDFDEAGIHEADIYDLGRLEPGMAFTGPAIIEDATTTIVVTPGRPVSMDAYGNIHIVME